MSTSIFIQIRVCVASIVRNETAIGESRKLNTDATSPESQNVRTITLQGKGKIVPVLN
jgi:hypothetical protein